jgi:hypothetical protein
MIVGRREAPPVASRHAPRQSRRFASMKFFEFFEIFGVQESLGIPEEKQVWIFFQKNDKFEKHPEVPRDPETSKNEKKS